MLTIKDLSARKELDRAAMSAVAGGTGLPGFALSNTATDLFDIVGSVEQIDATVITNVGNNGSLVLNVVDNDKFVNV